MKVKSLLLGLLSVIALSSCQDDDIVIPGIKNAPRDAGVYILCEGYPGNQSARVDYWDYDRLHINYSHTQNLGSANSIGEFASDATVHGSKMYVVVQGSNYIEVFNHKSLKKFHRIYLSGAHSVKGYGNYVYVTSNDGPGVEGNRLGYVAKIDTLTMEVVDTCVVGYSPEGLEITNNGIFVANSGRTRFPEFDNRLTLIDLQKFTVVRNYKIAPGVESVVKDQYDKLWIVSRGNYGSIKPQLHWFNPVTSELVDVNVPTTKIAIMDNNLYFFGTKYDKTGAPTTSFEYGIIDIRSRVKLGSFIREESQANIIRPYGLFVNPTNKDVYVLDTQGNSVHGAMHVIHPSGVVKQVVYTGELPSKVISRN